jgi:hypothetical protein
MLRNVGAATANIAGMMARWQAGTARPGARAVASHAITLATAGRRRHPTPWFPP